MLTFYPTVDNNVIPGLPLDLLSAGKLNEVEVMAGACTHEGHMMIPYIIPSLMSENSTYEDVKSQLEAFVKMVIEPISVDNTMAAIEKAYMDSAEKKVPGDKLFEAVVHAIGDSMLAIPTYHMVELVSGGLYEIARKHTKNYNCI